MSSSRKTHKGHRQLLYAACTIPCTRTTPNSPSVVNLSTTNVMATITPPDTRLGTTYGTLLSVEITEAHSEWFSSSDMIRIYRTQMVSDGSWVLDFMSESSGGATKMMPNAPASRMICPVTMV